MAELPEAARESDGGPDPRTTGYWSVWNSCAPDNRSELAAANGGRDAGYVLVDDLIADPGVGVGDFVLSTCEEGLNLLAGLTADGRAAADPAFGLAQQLLAAELNLSVGAESCPAAEEAAVGGQIVLAAADFDGVSTGPLDAEAEGALAQFTELLAAYNTGDLCR